MKETRTTNPELIQLINLLKKESREKQAGIWLDIAEYLSKTRSQRISVNLSKISRQIPGCFIQSCSWLNHAVCEPPKVSVRLGEAEPVRLT